MRASGDLDLSFSFTELGNDQTTMNMESFEEPADLSATYVSADHTKGPAARSQDKPSKYSSSSRDSKYQQELARLLNLQSNLINPSFKVLTVPSKAISTQQPLFTIQCQTNPQHIQEVTYRQARVLLNSPNVDSNDQDNLFNQNCKHCRQDEKQRAKDIQKEQEEQVFDRLREEQARLFIEAAANPPSSNNATPTQNSQNSQYEGEFGAEGAQQYYYQQNGEATYFWTREDHIAYGKCQMYIAQQQSRNISNEEMEAIRIVYLMMELSIAEIAGRLCYEGQ